MANYSEKFFRTFYNKLGKYLTLDRASKMVANIKQTTQTQFTNNIENSVILQELRNVPLEPHNPVPTRLVSWWQWYQHLVGLNTVEKARQEVILIQNELTKCREIRQALRQEAFIHNNRIKELYGELLTTKRDDPKYVALTILENKTLQEQTKNVEQLNLLEEKERGQFLHLTTAIKEYQDAQTLNSQKYKYLSVLASIVVALISLISSTIYSNARIHSIKQSILELQEKNETVIVNRYDSLKEHIDTMLSKIERNTTSVDSKPPSWNSYLRGGWAVTGIGSFLSWLWYGNANKETVTEAQTATPESNPETHDGWISFFKRTTFVFSFLLMLKGIF